MLIEQALAEIRTKIDALVGAPDVLVVIDGDAILVAREEIRSVRHAMDGIVFAQGVVKREGIVEKARLEMFQIERQRRFAHGRGMVGPEWRSRMRHDVDRPIPSITSRTPRAPMIAPAMRSIQRFERRYAVRGRSLEKASATIAYQPTSSVRIAGGSAAIIQSGGAGGRSA